MWRHPLSNYPPRLALDEAAPTWTPFAGRVLVKVVSDGQEFVHPDASWKLDTTTGWLAITSPRDQIIAIYREWESMRRYGANLASEEHREVTNGGVGFTPRLEGNEWHPGPLVGQPAKGQHPLLGEPPLSSGITVGSSDLPGWRPEAHTSALRTAARAVLALCWLVGDRIISRKNTSRPSG
jgi:hypothetical protein